MTPQGIFFVTFVGYIIALLALRGFYFYRAESKVKKFGVFSLIV
jgi:hypothetical protein